jgi:hypothetical protein
MGAAVMDSNGAASFRDDSDFTMTSRKRTALCNIQPFNIKKYCDNNLSWSILKLLAGMPKQERNPL